MTWGFRSELPAISWDRDLSTDATDQEDRNLPGIAEMAPSPVADLTTGASLPRYRMTGIPLQSRYDSGTPDDGGTS